MTQGVASLFLARSMARKAERQSLYERATYRDLRSRIAANARRLRSERKWTQEQAAEHCEMSWIVYQRVEAGATNLTLVTISRLVDGFGVEAAEMLAAVKRGSGRVGRRSQRR